MTASLTNFFCKCSFFCSAFVSFNFCFTDPIPYEIWIYVSALPDRQAGSSVFPESTEESELIQMLHRSLSGGSLSLVGFLQISLRKHKENSLISCSHFAITLRPNSSTPHSVWWFGLMAITCLVKFLHLTVQSNVFWLTALNVSKHKKAALLISSKPHTGLCGAHNAHRLQFLSGFHSTLGVAP